MIIIFGRKKLIEKIEKIQKEKREINKNIFSNDTDWHKGFNRGFEDGNDYAYNYIISLLKNKKI